ncbi:MULTISPECIES: H(+)/Cl(-) exchange transporter ClcA [Providencia]|uniref:H(+)/Cl(-) exchange transporter ClcA n=2 Tax=Providencia alcalifaciens TaxID=126385 RepID=A0AAW9V7Y6_9GAMM|nr:MULTISPECIES: H(+)/Cl(-) exchange transporter ClcA [Providencia]ATG16577.1 H(+)/Cl(-) exchange transporter ClcA [Providencia alcalifaciens]EEB44166.1 chloride transporter, ClC family [Providencia alcalifaciens DSM 30120]EKT67488.1 chloride channel protein [Providencia alcalifaciens Dmel2]ETT07130.1 H(+)/Cl(-) exchange transporter ClcA [Providencia alcalifaciens F90-2004]EUC96518.1 H(+)/Cl(-) exchange transporter ClcA [Providencia alcalifaciens PAL-2]
MMQANSTPKSDNKTHFSFLRHLKESDKTPLKVLVLAAIIGAVVGLIGSLFMLGTEWVSHIRVSSVNQYVTNKWLIIPAMFVASALLAMLGYYLVKRFSPESGGSGIPEIEGALQDLRPVRWWRVIPVKFIGGLGTLGSGMVLGREGPTVQLGANISQMFYDLFRLKDNESRHTLLAAGAAAGLSTAFNAPLAGILFIIEEMRPQFKYSLISIKAVFIGAVTATIVYRLINGEAAVLNIGQFSAAPMETLWLYLILGMLFGVVGIAFNRFLLYLQSRFLAFYQNKISRFVLMGGLIGGSCGAIGVFAPEVVGGGYSVIHQMVANSFTITLLMVFFALRFLTSTISFSSGAPGGIFSPLLALGTLFGGIYGYAALELFPNYSIEVGTFAIAGMGALFAATVRAPLTGIVLVLEMTSNYQLILPMIITCIGATMVAQFLGGRPLYSVLLEKTLERSEKQATASNA